MITVEQLKQHIEESNWPASEKRRANRLIESLGKKTIAFLFGRVDIYGSEVTVYRVLDTLEDLLSAFESLKNGDESPILEALSLAPDDPESNYGVFVLPFALDIKQLLRMNKFTKPNVLDAIRDFEVKLFSELPLDELAMAMQYDFLYFLSHLDFHLELKHYFYTHGIEDEAGQSKVLLDAINENEEILGTKRLMVDGKVVEPFIKSWVKDFIVTLPNVVSGRSTFDGIQYLNKSPNVAKISENEKQRLVSILKIYTWLLHPVVTEGEIEEYEQGTKEVVESGQAWTPEDNTPVARPVFAPTDAEQKLLEKQQKIAEALKRGAAGQALGAGGVIKSDSNIQDILNKKDSRGGVSQAAVAAPPDLSDIRKATINRNKQMSVDIDRRLQDLKKRSQ